MFLVEVFSIIFRGYDSFVVILLVKIVGVKYVFMFVGVCSLIL